MILLIKKIVRQFIERREIRKKFKQLEEHPLKTEELYRLASFSVSDLRDHFDLSCNKFNSEAKEFSLQHYTDMQRAKSIIVSKKMYGLDANEGAHFMPINQTPAGAARSSVVLYFKWNGKQINTNVSTPVTEPNLLHHVCESEHFKVQEDGRGHWESRLYPGTNRGLSLVAIATSSKNEKIILFDQELPISIVTRNDFKKEWSFYEEDISQENK